MIPRDKNGRFLEQDGLPVRLTQTMADMSCANRKYRTKTIDGERFLVIPLSQFRNGKTDFHSVEIS